MPKQDDALVGRGVGRYSRRYRALGRPEPKEPVAGLGIRGRSITLEGPVLCAAVLVKVIEELREATRRAVSTEQRAELRIPRRVAARVRHA